MFFNYDSLFVVGSVIFIVGGIFTLSKYNIFTSVASVATVNKGESLVNTIPNLDTVTKLPEGPEAAKLLVLEPSNLQYVEASVLQLKACS